MSITFPSQQVFTSVIQNASIRAFAVIAASTGFLAFSAQSESAGASALHCFCRLTVNEFQARLEEHRPAPVSRNEKALILQSLPEEGELLNLQPSARQKLASLRTILRLHQRDYSAIVIDVPQAFIGLHGRAVVLISEPALSVLDTEELQAQVAHEIGHEYVWDEYENAKGRNDYRTLQGLELFCDGVAVVTLREAGIDTSRLATGLEKVSLFNRQRFGQALNENAYPSFGERKKFIQTIRAWAER